MSKKAPKEDWRKEMAGVMSGFSAASAKRKELGLGQGSVTDAQRKKFMATAKEMGREEEALAAFAEKEDAGEDVDFDESEGGDDLDDLKAEGLRVMTKDGPEAFFEALNEFPEEQSAILEKDDEWQDDLAEGLWAHIKALEQTDDLNSVKALLDSIYDEWPEIITQSLQQSEDSRIQDAYINIAKLLLKYDGSTDFFAFFADRDIEPELRAEFDKINATFVAPLKGMEKVKANKAYTAGWTQKGGRRSQKSRRSSSRKRKSVSRKRKSVSRKRSHRSKSRRSGSRKSRRSGSRKRKSSPRKRSHRSKSRRSGSRKRSHRSKSRRSGSRKSHRSGSRKSRRSGSRKRKSSLRKSRRSGSRKRSHRSKSRKSSSRKRSARRSKSRSVSRRLSRRK